MNNPLCPTCGTTLDCDRCHHCGEDHVPIKSLEKYYWDSFFARVDAGEEITVSLEDLEEEP